MTNDDIHIIIIDDDEDIRVTTEDLLSTQFKNVVSYSSVSQVLKNIKPYVPWVILTDLRMPDADGLEFCKSVIDIDRQLPVILMTGYGDISTAVDAIKHGVYDFIEKPFDSTALLSAVNRAVEKRVLTLSLHKDNAASDNVQKIDNYVVGNTPIMKQLKNDILELAPMDIPIMIYGETGTGKELVAQCLHDFSSRHKQRFVALNCAAIPHELAESELFGHAKGAFTDAKSEHSGKLIHANGGTLFLDEVESLPLGVQAKLLRALSNNKVTPVGSHEELSFNCRIISASKDELRNNPDFRQDLFFRLQVAEIRIPALRERSEDIIRLFEIFSMQHCARLGTQYKSADAHTKERLLSYDWPGNVRELLNVSTRYALKNCSDISYALDNARTVNTPVADSMPLKQMVENYEASIIKLKLYEHKGKVSKVLDDLGLERRTFNQKLNRYGIQTTDYRED